MYVNFLCNRSYKMILNPLHKNRANNVLIKIIKIIFAML
jgi:hypothetical protein